jgi:glutaredoxin
MAWKLGLKTLYYCRSEKIGKADKVAKKIEREAIKELSMKALAAGETRTKAIIYGTNTCVYCDRAKMVLTQKGITFDFINLQDLGKTAAEVTGRPVKSVPQIYLEGKYVGGFNELVKELNNNSNVDDSECLACEG